MNILFVNYGNFTTNSLNHISGFTRWLSGRGHACIVVVPSEKETFAAVPEPAFRAATYSEVLAEPHLFPDGRAADIIHAWTPREGVRKFVAAYQRQRPTHLIVHLEDNEEHLLEAFGGRPANELRDLPRQRFPFPMVDGLPHPVNYRQFLRLADGITVINDRLREFVPSSVPARLLPPGVDFELYHPLAPDTALRRELGLRDGERVLVFTGSVTYANLDEMTELYRAVRQLNQQGTPVRLIRTGFTQPEFVAGLGFDPAPWVIELGFVAKSMLPRLLALADVLVQPGQSGPFNDYRLPSKLPEYFASGRPVVLPAANVGLLVADGREALVLRSGEATEIAAACRRIFTDQGFAAALGQAGREFARRHFDPERNTAALLRFYEEVRAKPPQTAWQALHATEETDLVAQLALLRSQLSAQAPTDPTLRRELLDTIDDLERSLRQLDADLRERAGTVADLRRHSAGLEETREILRRDIVTVRAHAAEHARQLETKLARIETAAREIADTAAREVTRLQDELYQSEYRVQRMQATFSWRATAWLRALRRWLLDPIMGPPQKPPPPPLPERTIRLGLDGLSLLPAAPKLFAHLDAPRRWPGAARDLVVRGWVVSEAGPLRGVRARLGGRLYAGEYGLGRPDVGHNLRQYADAGRSGFRLVLTVEESDARVVLEAEDASGQWHVFYEQAIGPGAQLAVRGTYAHWVEQHDTLASATLDRLRARVPLLSVRPVFSVLMPVFNTPERWLVRAIESVRAQVYPHWELCLTDDASTQPHIREVLERYARMDPRIKPRFHPENRHVAAATNTALSAATGDFCALLDHDDELAPHALFCLAETIATYPTTELLYTDEDKIDELGHRFDPHFKPDWNPDLLTGQNYLSHLTAIRTTTLRDAGGFRPGFDGAQDWDVFLRVTERVPAESIRHVPRVLYHWRAIEGSTAMQLQEKDYTVQAARRALEEHFARRGEKVGLELRAGGHWRVLRLQPDPAPLVTLIIPTRNRRELLETCIGSIFARTAYPNFEILVADNDSDDPQLTAYYERMKSEAPGRFAVLPCPGSFNYSAINNRAVQAANGELVALLNNDLETMHPEWLDELVAHALRPGIGCVGAKLYYPDQSIQHAGVITGLGGVAGHAFKGFTRDEPGTPQFRPHLVHNVSAVTAACLVIRKETYLRAGGLDEEGLGIAFNDVDFCLKVEALGLRNVFTPFAELIHHESASRGAEDTPDKVRRFQNEIACIQRKWGDRLLRDPAYNPNLTLDSEDFGFAYPPRLAPLAPAGD